jgi:dynein heavy chain
LVCIFFRHEHQNVCFPCLQACEEFKAISRKLYEKPNTVEELSEMREWMKDIPDKLKEHQELIDKAMSDYELIEEFNYNLSSDDFNAK